MLLMPPRAVVNWRFKERADGGHQVQLKITWCWMKSPMQSQVPCCWGSCSQFSVIVTVLGAFVFANNAIELKEPIQMFFTFPSLSLSLKAHHSRVDHKIVAECWLTYYTLCYFRVIEVVEGVVDKEKDDGEEGEEDDEID